MAASIGFYHADVDQAAQILLKMWRCFKDNDATLVEINPLAKIGDPDDESTKQLSALDAKISLDDNASFRHDGWARFVDPIVPDPFEQRAREHGLHYVHLHGEVGVIGNGAGLVMSSLDAVSGAGEEQGTNIKPANFLDIGGGASAAVMAESLEIVLSDPQVESVFINVYGGITSCVEVANGILEAVAKLGGSKPIVVRFDGNAAAEGLHILASANNPNIHVSETMEGAGRRPRSSPVRRPSPRRFADAVHRRRRSRYRSGHDRSSGHDPYRTYAQGRHQYRRRREPAQGRHIRHLPRCQERCRREHPRVRHLRRST